MKFQFVLRWLLRVFPSELGGDRIRKIFYKKTFLHSNFKIPQNVTFIGIENVSIGEYFRVCPDVKLICENGGEIKIGGNFFANYKTFIFADGNKVEIGDDCLIGPDVLIINTNHQFNPNELIRCQNSVSSDINIGNDVWIGAKSMILSGVTIGNGAVIAGGSVVNKNVAPYSVVGGVPAQFLKHRK